jgi:hypothetical protein
VDLVTQPPEVGFTISFTLRAKVEFLRQVIDDDVERLVRIIIARPDAGLDMIASLLMPVCHPRLRIFAEPLAFLAY